MLGETIRVHMTLKGLRAMTLCWTAKTPSRRRSMAMLGTSAPAWPESIVLGTSKSPTNPIA